MFTWICPKCGGEVPPAYDDCPRCAPPKPVERPPVARETESAPSKPAPAATPRPSEPAPLQAPPQPVNLQPPPPPPPPALTADSTPRRAFPPAFVALGAFAGIAAVLALLYLYVLPGNKGTSAKTTDAAALEQPGPAGTAGPVHPLAKHIEITGLRLEGLRGGQVKIQFVVVNHSAADLPELKMNVALRSTDRVFFEFPATVPSLGPFEVKDLTASAKTDLKPYELPDWQLLKPQFRIEKAP